MKNFIQKSFSIDVIVPVDVSSGVPFVCGKLVAIPVCDAKAGELVTIYTEGIFELNISSPVAIGDTVYLQKDGTVGINSKEAFPFGFAVESAQGGFSKIMLVKSILMEPVL